MTNSKRKRMIREHQAKTNGTYQSSHRALTGGGGGPTAPVPPRTLPTDWHGFGARVVRLIGLAEIEAVEAEEHSKTYLDANGTVLLGDVTASKGPAYAALLAEIQTFDDADSRKLEALMHSGRERVSLRTMHRQLRFDTPEHERSQVMSKRGSALPEYLRRALEQARAANVDLDADLPDARLLSALAMAGVSDASLDRWDPAYLSLRQSNSAISADAEFASRTARENAARGAYSLDLGHEAIGIPKAAGLLLEAHLAENQIPFERRSLTRDYLRAKVEKMGVHQRHVLSCLRWDSTQFTQTVEQLWQLAQRAGIHASMDDIQAAAAKLARGGIVSQKGGSSSDCFWLTEKQLWALGGQAVPTWAEVR